MDRLLGNIIAIVLMLLVLVRFAYAGYSGFQSHKASVVVNGVAQTITNAHAGFSQSNNSYVNSATINIPAMIDDGMFLTGTVRGNTIVDPWGDPVAFASTNNASRGVAGFGGDGSGTASQYVKVATDVKGYVSLNINGQVFTQVNLSDQVTTGTVCSATAAFSVTFQ